MTNTSSMPIMHNPQFQIISDLHLEAPIQTPSYSYLSTPANFPLLASNLFLLGDIGLVFHSQPLLAFLRSLLSRDSKLKIYYVMGNHEPYHMTVENAVKKMEQWEEMLNKEFGQRFYFLNRRRVDLDAQTTILGCILWTCVPDEHAQEVARTLNDLSDENGIWDRSLDDHNADHKRDLMWLNEQVESIEEEPHREVVILTHHSPTTDPRANDRRFPPERSLNSGFRTDLRKEACWTSRKVKLWGFGHTHFSCQLTDEEEGRRKLVVANQKGYAKPEGKGSWEAKPVVVGREEGVWKVVVGEKKAS
ncbi:uncharacterized protein EKO05_0010350 [Ascochyta rabiei]|uniref:Hydrolase n=1 Tax=Didymella rabiei TaxID=5454 RepID=A0A162WH19_DIDRA|nr:uncharacterized protein EKO05_0010350 [Ascochyta rabiei]KZM19022.1 hydrolase [Ascochyta rabiei]UPX20106.1 hypothetical protein EKO05_0010350 [Ascochyta rabiei]